MVVIGPAASVARVRPMPFGRSVRKKIGVRLESVVRFQQGRSWGAFDGREKPGRYVKTLSPRVVFDALVPAQELAKLPEAHGDDSK